MSKRSVCLLIALAIIGGIFLPATRHVLLGLLGVEPLIALRPMSAWRQALTSSEPGVSSAATYELTRAGSDASPLLPDLITMLDSDNWLHRRNGAVILGSIGQKAHPALPKLIQLLQHDDTRVKLNVPHALAQIAPDDPAVQTALRAALQDHTEHLGYSVSDEAAKALDRIPR